MDPVRYSVEGISVTDTVVSVEDTHYPIAQLSEVKFKDHAARVARRQKLLDGSASQLKVANGLTAFGLLLPPLLCALTHETVTWNALLFILFIAVASLVTGRVLRKGAYGSRESALKTRTASYSVAVRLKHDGSTLDILETENMGSAKELAAAVARAMDRLGSGAALHGSAGQLADLEEMASSGLIEKDEYERAKSLLLGMSEASRRGIPGTLRQLKQLHSQGVLSDQEYATKKWAVMGEVEM